MAIDLEKWKLAADLGNKARTKEVVSRFTGAGIELVLMKGWANSRFYDVPHFRTYTDVDIVVSPFWGDKAQSLLRDINIPGTVIDLHIGLRHLDRQPWDSLFKSTYIAYLDDTPVRVLADEDNLRITAVHWLTDGGVNKEKLWDIYYLVKNRREGFDWGRCLDSNGPIRRTWVVAAIATARDYLALDVSTLPEDTKSFQLPKWYKRTLEREWKRGLYSRRILSAVIKRPKLFAEQIYRRFPPNPIAATIDVEAPIDESFRAPLQFQSLFKKAGPFARGLAQQLGHNRRGGY